MLKLLYLCAISFKYSIQVNLKEWELFRCIFLQHYASAFYSSIIPIHKYNWKVFDNTDDFGELIISIYISKFLRKLFKTIQLFWNSFKGWRFHVLSQQSTALLKFLLHILLYMSLIFHFLQYYFRTILLWYLLFRISFYFFISSHIISF